MKKRKTKAARRQLLGIWTRVLAVAERCITADREAGLDVSDQLQVRRLIKRRISRLKRLINTPSLRLKKNSLLPIGDRRHNGLPSGVENG